MDGIAEMFTDLDGYTAYFDEIYATGFYLRSRAVEVTANWRLNNPERFRMHHRASAKKWRKNNPEKARVLKRRYVDKHREHMRDVWKKNSAAYRARKKAK